MGAEVLCPIFKKVSDECVKTLVKRGTYPHIDRIINIFSVFFTKTLV
jgi:hypothetical protein